MAVSISSPNMVVQLQNHRSMSPPIAKILPFSNGSSVKPLKFNVASISTVTLPSFTIKVYQTEQAPTTPGEQSLDIAVAKQSRATVSKEKEATQTSMDYQEVLKYPLLTESAMKKVIEQNTLVFVVDVRANKKDIRNAFEKMLRIKTKKINTLINYDGTKKAYVKLSPENAAVTIAKKLKILA